MGIILKNINVRKRYKTRSGNPVELWCVDPAHNRSFPVKGHILSEGKRFPGAWTRKGRWPQEVQRTNHADDLIEIPEEEWVALVEPQSKK